MSEMRWSVSKHCSLNLWLLQGKGGERVKKNQVILTIICLSLVATGVLVAFYPQCVFPSASAQASSGEWTAPSKPQPSQRTVDWFKDIVKGYLFPSGGGTFGFGTIEVHNINLAQTTNPSNSMNLPQPVYAVHIDTLKATMVGENITVILEGVQYRGANPSDKGDFLASVTIPSMTIELGPLSSLLTS